jgi:hypothetical protein
MGVVVLVFLLVPFYVTGGNVPSMGPGWYPTEPHEFESIARYQGTMWEQSTFLQDAFWRIGCFGLCAWLPLLMIVSLEISASWPTLSQRQKQVRQFVRVGSIVVTGLWIMAGLRMVTIGE